MYAFCMYECDAFIQIYVVLLLCSFFSVWLHKPWWEVPQSVKTKSPLCFHIFVSLEFIHIHKCCHLLYMLYGVVDGLHYTLLNVFSVL